jgi:hypothetical protein
MKPISRKGIVSIEVRRVVEARVTATDHPYLSRPKRVRLTLGARESEGIDPYELTYRTAGNAFWLLQNVAFPMKFWSERGEVLGEIHFWDGPSLGSDYQGVTASSSEALSYLQLFLNQGDSGIHIRLRTGSRLPRTHLER